MNEKNTNKTTHSTANSLLLLHPNATDRPPPPTPPTSGTNEATSPPLLQPMCWFLLITIVAWLTIALLITAITLYITRNLASISILAPLASPACFLYRILKPMLPMDEKRFTIAKMKIQKFPKIELSRKKETKKN